MKAIDYIDVLNILNEEICKYFSESENRKLTPVEAYNKLYKNIKNRIMVLKDKPSDTK